MTNRSNTQSSESQQIISPDQALQLLLDGNKAFLEAKFADRDLLGQVKTTSTGQYPHSIVLGCVDSRVPPETVFDCGIGDIFSARIAGNFVNEDILGSMEFACKLAGSKLVMVLGHTACGAVKGACDHAKLGNLTAMLEKIAPAVDATPDTGGDDRSSKNINFVNAVVEENVRQTVANISERSSVLRELAAEGSIRIVGAIYDISTGKVSVLD